MENSTKVYVVHEDCGPCDYSLRAVFATEAQAIAYVNGAPAFDIDDRIINSEFGEQMKCAFCVDSTGPDGYIRDIWVATPVNENRWWVQTISTNGVSLIFRGFSTISRDHALEIAQKAYEDHGAQHPATTCL